MAKKKAAAKKKAVGKKKVVSKKVAAKKVAGKKKATGKKKAASKKKAAAGSKDKKPPTKSEIMATIAEETDLSKAQVAAVIESLSGLIAKNLAPRGPQYFNLPGLMKIKVVKKAARKARMGINRFTGEEMMFKAKPASKAVKITPLKMLKEMV